jgi:hypothetical protein
VLFSLSVILSSFSIAQDSLIVGAYDIKPWFYKEKGIYKGHVYDLYEKLSKKSSIKFKYTILPYKRLQTDFIKGKFDIISDFNSSRVSKHSSVVGELLNVRMLIIGNEKIIQAMKNKKL